MADRREALTLIAGGVLIAASPSGAGEIPMTCEEASYHEDVRFLVPITLTGSKLEWQGILGALGDATGTPFVIEGAWLRKRVRGAVRDVTAAKLMDFLAERFDCCWEYLDPFWLLRPTQRARGEKTPRADLVVHRPSPSPEYWRDFRLEDRISIPAQVLEAEDLVRRIAKDGNAPLHLKEEWSTRVVGICARAVQVRELMRALARLLSGEWHLIGPYWVLSDTKIAAERIAQREARRAAERQGGSREEQVATQYLDALASSLTPQQWARLEQGDQLGMGDLTPRQQRLFRDALNLFMRDPDGPRFHTPRPLALTGENVRISLERKPDARLLVFSWPTVNPLHDGSPVLSRTIRR